MNLECIWAGIDKVENSPQSWGDMRQHGRLITMNSWYLTFMEVIVRDDEAKNLLIDTEQALYFRFFYGRPFPLRGEMAKIFYYIIFYITTFQLLRQRFLTESQRRFGERKQKSCWLLFAL
jgi:hypothetical protein